MIHNVTAFCSSSSKPAPVYRDAAEALGRAIALRGWGLVYGGNYVGLMAVLADAVRAGGGRMIGVTPQLFIDQGIGDARCTELVICATMPERKEMLERRGDAIVALPGGLGTLEEIFDAIVGKSLGRHKKPIVLLNIGGYYAPLLTLIEHGIVRQFIKPAARDLYFVADGVDEAIEYLGKSI
jgi:uncharacterized protein (TIGR00730 family)